MRLYLAQSFPDGWGGIKRTSEALSVTRIFDTQMVAVGIPNSERELKLHLAERDPQHHAWPKRGVDKESLRLRILLSYWYYKDVDLDALFAKYFTEPYPDVFADSGAFSAMTQGISITVKEYAGWIKRWSHLFSSYANLDVIKDAQRTWNNQKKLEDLGLSPLPCFHVLEDFKWLERYVELYPYICLGVAGMQQRKRELMAWLVKCFKITESLAVFHGFALTSWEVMSTFRWYSVDSSSWGQGFRYGTVPVFDEHKGRFHKLDLGNVSHWRWHAELIRSLGFDPVDFADRERNDRAKICAISALSYMLAERWLRKRHGEVRIPQRDSTGAGPRLHLADANPARFGEAVVGASGDRLHLSDTSSGINFGDADKGLKLHLADARPHSGGEITAANTGLKLHLTDSPWVPMRYPASAQKGLRVYLSEHFLDRGG